MKEYGLETIEKSQSVLPIIIECFEKESLEYFGQISNLPLVFLIKEDNPEVVMSWLPDVAKYAHAIGPKS